MSLVTCVRLSLRSRVTLLQVLAPQPRPVQVEGVKKKMPDSLDLSAGETITAPPPPPATHFIFVLDDR